MEATDLRIGNWVALKEQTKIHLHQDCEIWADFENKVTIIEGGEGGMVHLWVDNQHVEFEYHEIEPIPLTEEWLIKFGFENYGFLFLRYSIENILVVDLEDFTSGINEHDVFWLLNKDMLYVHQLQNLYFALTGKELTIHKAI